MSASTMPAMTRRIEGAVFNRRATRATTTSTAISRRSVWIVTVTGHTLFGQGALEHRPRLMSRRDGRNLPAEQARGTEAYGSIAALRHAAGGTPKLRLKARLNAASES